MRCPTCKVPLIFTGIVCLCEHKQYLCPNCRHILSYDHTLKEYKIDRTLENHMKEKARQKDTTKIKPQTYGDWVDSLIKKNEKTP